MKTVNVIKLSGNLTKDVEVCKPKGENAQLGEFLGISIAYNGSYRDSNGNWQKVKPSFYSLVVKKESVKKQFLDNDIRKGDHVVIEGRLSQNKETGAIYIVVTKLEEFDRCQNNQLDSGKEATNTEAPRSKKQNANHASHDEAVA